MVEAPGTYRKLYSNKRYNIITVDFVFIVINNNLNVVSIFSNQLVSEYIVS